MLCMDAVKEIDSRRFVQWQQSGLPVRLVDVRSLNETARGVIQGAEWIPLHLLPIHVDVLARTTNANEPLVLYCRSGARSHQACAFLMRRGMKNVFNLQDGIIGWTSLGKKLVALQTELLFAS